MRNVLIVGLSADDRSRAVRAAVPLTHTLCVLDAGTLPFTRVGDVAFPPPPFALVIADVDRAFPDRQAGGTRLVLTQSTYLLQKWIDMLGDDDRLVVTADREALARCAPEALQRRGPWSAFDIVDLDVDTNDTSRTEPRDPLQAPRDAVCPVSVRPLNQLLAKAFDVGDTAERLALCQEATSLDPSSAVAQLALASACREARDGAAAREALERGAVLAPDWEAIAYESGKLWLVYDDLPRAREAFQRAADLMPTFSSAWSNLGATLGELDEPDAALAAFRRALAHDPHSVTLLNNIGVVSRQLGHFDESEAALRQAIATSRGFVFAHYNLGHTLFLAGQYDEALRAYEDGRGLDPQQNRRQGCRMAMTRLATGDAAGAESEFWSSVNGAPADEREDLLLEAYEIGVAIFTLRPGLEPHRPFLDRIGAEITKSE